MEGSSGPVSAMPDLPSQVSAMARAGRDAEGSGSVGQGSDGKRRCGFERVFY